MSGQKRTLVRESDGPQPKKTRNNGIKKNLKERILLGADVTIDDFEEDMDIFTQALNEAELDVQRKEPTEMIAVEPRSSVLSMTNNPSLIVIDKEFIQRVTDNPECSIFVYKPSANEQNPWEMMVRRSEGTRHCKKWEDFPKGVGFKITEATKIVSQTYNNESYAVIIENLYDVFLPTRFTKFIDAMGVDWFLKAEPYAFYFGRNTANNAHVLLIFPKDDLYKVENWKIVYTHAIQYLHK